MAKVTIKDIAREAGVSAGTVDRVIHKRGKVDKEKQKRILAVMKKLRYEPNRYAAAMALNRQVRIACLILDHRRGEYWETVEEGILDARDALSDFNLDIHLFKYDPYDYDSFRSAADEILSEAFDGIVIAPTEKAHTLAFTETLDGLGIPYVFVDSNLAEARPLAFFAQHPGRSGEFVASILGMVSASRGNRIAVFRTMRQDISGSNPQLERLQGFESFLRLQFPEVKPVFCDLPHRRNKKQDGQLLDRFFRENPGIRMGVFFNSRAYIVGEYLREHPDPDFLLSGYDLLPRNVACIRDGQMAIAISQHPHEQGFRAVQALCDHLVLQKAVSPEHYMPIDLVNRHNIDYYVG